MPIAAPCAATWRAWSPAAASTRRPNSGPNSTTTCAPLSRPAGRPGIFLSHRRQPGTRWPALPAGRAHRGRQPATVLLYAHGDVVRGYDEQWRDGLSPWTLVEEGERWYGRGTADNKGQYCINVAALEQVLAERGGAWASTPACWSNAARSRLARPARRLRPVARRLEGRRLHRIGRPAPGGGPAHAVPRFARHAAVRPGGQSAQPCASLRATGAACCPAQADPGARAGQPGRRARPPAS